MISLDSNDLGALIKTNVFIKQVFYISKYDLKLATVDSFGLGRHIKINVFIK